MILEVIWIHRSPRGVETSFFICVGTTVLETSLTRPKFVLKWVKRNNMVEFLDQMIIYSITNF